MVSLPVVTGHDAWPYIVFTYPTATTANLEPVCRFLSTFFGDPPRTPVYQCNPLDWMRPKDIVIVVYDSLLDPLHILGCIRYRALGHWAGHERYLVDSFCIHPQYRHRGLGRFLLHTLHQYANERGIPYAMFLKEGTPLSWWIPAMYRGRYVVMKQPLSCSLSTAIGGVTDQIQRISTTCAHRLVRQYAIVYPHAFIVQPVSVESQEWVDVTIRSEGAVTRHVLLCVQDTHQLDHDGQRMGIVTACLDSHMDQMPPITAILLHRVQAMGGWNYPRIWMDRDIQSSDGTEEDDGAFHWYTYQWNGPTICPRRCVILHE